MNIFILYQNSEKLQLICSLEVQGPSILVEARKERFIIPLAKLSVEC